MAIEQIVHGKLPGAVFDFSFYNGAQYHCCVLKASFHIHADGELQLIDDQPGLVFGDQYDLSVPPKDEEVYMTSRDLLYASDLIPYKPVTDVLVVGSAQAPGGKPLDQWLATVRLGSVNKIVRLTGPRHWQRKTLGGWQLTNPEPVAAVPLLYSRAYGGRLRPEVEYADLKPTELDVRNPYGRGFEAGHGGRQDRYPAPQIEYPDSLANNDPLRQIKVAGLSPIPGHFWDRLKLSGTYDAQWEAQVKPNIPLDMDLRYWNNAPEDQQIAPYLRGDEALHLDGLFATGPVDITLPNLIAWAQVDDVHGKQQVERMVLDTVTVDLDKRQLSLRWGFTTPWADDIRRISLHCPRQDDWYAKQGGA